MKGLRCKACVQLVMLLFLSMYTSFGQAAEETVVGATEEQKTSLIQLYSWSTVLPKALIDLQAWIEDDASVEKIEKILPNLAEETESLRWEVNRAKTSPELQVMVVTANQRRVQKISSRLDNISGPLEDVIRSLSLKRREWQIKKNAIGAFESNDFLKLGSADEQLQMLQMTIGQAFEIIEKRLVLALNLGRELGEVQILLYGIESDLKDLNKELLAVSIQQTSPSMLSSNFYSRINSNLLDQAKSNFKQFSYEQLRFLKNNVRFVLLSFVSLVVVAVILRKTRTLVPSSSRWYPFAACPFATTVFLAVSLNGIMGLMNLHMELQQNWEHVLKILMLFAVIRLTRHLVHSKWQRGLLIPLTGFLVVVIGMVVVKLPQIFLHLFVFYVSVLAFLFYLYQLKGLRNLSKGEAWSRRILGITPAILIVSGVFGYDQFGVILFSTVLGTVIASLVIWMLYMLHLGIYDFVLLVAPFEILNDNREVIVNRLKPIVFWTHLILYVAVLAVIWDISPTVNEALKFLFNAGVEMGGVNLTPGFFITVGLVFYAALLCSKGIQALLLIKVLPGYGAERGVQLSIARLVHYAILTVGFIVMLKMLGFELNQLTILGGALGVGIGFGLQATVNNFASGLILLFERPIKVGDTIQIGTDLGEVKNMGLRATVIQTFDNAEIVVPNSDLVTGQVTNWTLAERRVRIRVTVGVAFGSEVAKIL
jgi:potassium efflux system protein